MATEPPYTMYVNAQSKPTLPAVLEIWYFNSSAFYKKKSKSESVDSGF